MVRRTSRTYGLDFDGLITLKATTQYVWNYIHAFCANEIFFLGSHKRVFKGNIGVECLAGAMWFERSTIRSTKYIAYSLSSSYHSMFSVYMVGNIFHILWVTIMGRQLLFMDSKIQKFDISCISRCIFSIFILLPTFIWHR